MVERAETDEAIVACYDVMAELRPHLRRENFLATVRAMQKDGLRLACIREGGRVVAVAGYRISDNLFCGRHLYVDDLVTSEAERHQRLPSRGLVCRAHSHPPRSAAGSAPISKATLCPVNGDSVNQTVTVKRLSMHSPNARAHFIAALPDTQAAT